VAIAGMSKGNIYVYFDSKEEIFIVLLERWRDQMMKDIHEDVDRANGSLASLIENMAERLHYYSVHERHFLLSWLEFTMAAGRNEQVRARLNEIQKGLSVKLEGFFQKMADEGRIIPQDVTRLALLLDSFFAGLIVKSLMGSDKSIDKDALKDMVGFLDEILRERIREANKIGGQ